MLGEYTFVVTDLLSGNIIDTVEMSSWYWDEIYNLPGAGLGTAKFDLPTTSRTNFRDWANGFWVIKDGVIKWGGIIAKTQRRGGTRVLSIPVVGFYEYLNNRFLRGAEGMTSGTIMRISDIEWRNVDPFLIFKDCVDHIQSFTDGDIGLGVEWDALSAQVVTLIYPTFNVKNIGALLYDLSNRLETGFDFQQVYRFEGNVPKCNFKLTFPQLSTDVGDTLLFQPEEKINITTPVLSRMDALTGSFSGANTGDQTSIVGDITIPAALKMTTYLGASRTIRSKWGVSGNISYRFRLLSDAKLIFEWSEDGIAIQSVTSATALPVATGNVELVRIVMDVDNGAGGFDVTFEHSIDYGLNWTVL